MNAQILTWNGPYESGRILLRSRKMIFPSPRPIARCLLSAEMAIDASRSPSSMTGPTWVNVDVCRKNMERSAEVAMNLSLGARTMEWMSLKLPPWYICDSASTDPTGMLKDLSLLSDATKICRPSLDHTSGVTGTFRSMVVLMVTSLSPV